MRLFFLIPCCLTAMSSFSQTLIQGKVSDDKGQAIPGANIILEDTYDGTTSDAEGKFTFRTSETGTKNLLVKFIGYKDFVQVVNLKGETVSAAIVLQEQINELQAVTITAGAFTASDASRRTVFRAVDIATTAGATADIAGALNTLPGTQKVGESGRLFVRGGDGSETRTFIDGMVVLDAYGPAAPNTPSRGRFLPFMFKGTSFSTGGYSAEFGQALSSALVLDSKDESEITRTDIGILSVGGDVAHTQAWEGGSAAGKIQYTNIRPYFGLINQEIDWKTPPASIEAVGAFRQKTGGDGMIKIYGNFNQSSFSLYNHDIDNHDNKQLYDLTNKYRYLNSFYKTSLSNDWAFRSGLSYTYIQDDALIDGLNLSKTETGLHAKGVVEGSLSSSFELKTGVEVIRRNYSEQSPSIENEFSETIVSAFGESDVYISNKFVTRLGGRLEYNSLQSNVSVDPRVSLAYQTNKNGQVSLAYGIFRQSPQNHYLKQNTGLASERAGHFILNYQYLKNGRTFRIETYYKSYKDLVKYEGNSVNNDGSGYAKGVEVFWRDNESIKRLDYWVSYSFLDTERNYLHFPHMATPVFASRNNFSIVGKYFVQSLKSQLGATYSYASGRPYYNPNGERFHHSRTPSYQDLSFNWSYLPRPHLIFYFSCTNLLGRENIFGYEYSSHLNENGAYNGRPIRQPAPRFVFLGIFITLSKSKSMNQLPTL